MATEFILEGEGADTKRVIVAGPDAGDVRNVIAQQLSELSQPRSAELPAVIDTKPAGDQQETREEARARIVREMDERDEEQILQDLAGLALRYVQRFIYAYCPNHKDAKEDPQTGWPKCGCPSSEWIIEVTYDGVKEASNREALQVITEAVTVKRGKLLNRRRYREATVSGSLMVETIENTFDVIEELADVPDYVEAHAYARRVLPDNRVMVRQGFAREALQKRRRDGVLYDNEFPELKAVGKAQRNAQKILISQLLVRDWIDKFLGLTTGAANDQGLQPGGEKKAGPKTILGRALTAKYGDDKEAKTRAFQTVTEKRFFPNAEPGTKGYNSFLQISDDEATLLLADLAVGKLKLPEREIMFPQPTQGKREREPGEDG